MKNLTRDRGKVFRWSTVTIIQRTELTIALLSVEDEQADAGRDGRIRLARPNSQARTGTGKYSFSLLS